jgi:peptidoglycan lytic transglycosylase
MYVPMTLGQPTAALAPVAIAASEEAVAAPPAHTALRLVTTRLNVLDGERASVTGRLVQTAPRAPLAGRPLVLQELSRHRWRTLAHTRTRAGGRFRIRYVARRLGSAKVRLLFTGDATERAAHHRLGRLNVYRLAGASWYGGGGSLACGGSLSSSTLGVANKTLPCGTIVTLHYGGRTVSVPVIDRGPYVAGREFDLTEATKRELGFGDTGTVWSTA